MAVEEEVGCETLRVLKVIVRRSERAKRVEEVEDHLGLLEVGVVHLHVTVEAVGTGSLLTGLEREAKVQDGLGEVEEPGHRNLAPEGGAPVCLVGEVEVQKHLCSSPF